MEELKKKNMAEAGEKEIVYSQAIKAGKRIYYIDVKKSRKDEMFLTITESKKIVNGEGENAQINFEKHKIFLYKEDFEKFTNSLQQAISFIEGKQGNHNRTAALDEPTTLDEAPEEETTSQLGEEIKIDIDF